MQTVIAAVFWISLALTLYVAVVYPCLLRLLSRLQRTFTLRESTIPSDEADLPTVSVILPALADDKYLLDRLQNLLESDFPTDGMEVVVGCDPQDELIADLVATVNDPRVRAVHCESPRGKVELINACLAEARNEIVLITDCGVRFDRNTIRRLAVGFCSPHVGGVCGRLPATDDGAFDATGEQETRFGVLPDRRYAVAAYRAELLGVIPEGVKDVGLFAGLSVYRSGLEIVFDAGAVARRRSGQAERAGQRQNVIVRTFDRLRGVWKVLRVSGCSAASLVVCSHQLRRIAPVFVIAAMMSNAILAGDPLYLRLLLLHEIAYVMLLLHLCLRNRSKKEKGEREKPLCPS